jgi:hypothetical protein
MSLLMIMSTIQALHRWQALCLVLVQLALYVSTILSWIVDEE